MAQYINNFRNLNTFKIYKMVKKCNLNFNTLIRIIFYSAIKAFYTFYFCDCTGRLLIKLKMTQELL